MGGEIEEGKKKREGEEEGKEIEEFKRWEKRRRKEIEGMRRGRERD